MASVVVIDNIVHPAAVPYFHQVPTEPIPGSASAEVAVGKILTIDKMPLEKLLGTILKEVKPGGSLLLVCHGNSEGLFATIGRDRKRGTSMLQRNACDEIRHNLEGTSSDEETAAALFLELKDWQRLKALIEKMQALELDRVDARACNTGANEVAMSELQRFFNCKTFCAPKIYDTFGQIPIGRYSTDRVVWEEWLKNHKGSTIHGLAPNRLAMRYKVEMSPPKVVFDVLADSKKAVANWVAAHLPKGTFSEGSPLYHGVASPAPQKLVFAGDPEYRGLLVEATKGNAPSRKVNVDDLMRAPLPR